MIHYNSRTNNAGAKSLVPIDSPYLTFYSMVLLIEVVTLSYNSTTPLGLLHYKRAFITVGPSSSYCWLLIQSDCDDTVANILPPIQTLYFLSGGLIILTFDFGGAKLVISFCILSENPGNIVLPPVNMIFEYKSFLTSMSHPLIEL